ncbi:hypothetical protein RchiOBHm_Chr1g0314241 [Rosa chinensis]|uniref:Uncharacterized protein n=1 Tax=Rosa chinensis TaxID=74649 RepID=A0A2P6S720_ROSCH|nr:hypothetical protein RchiOBHm_Chr1g0314241 [Rosa chinensis]
MCCLSHEKKSIVLGPDKLIRLLFHLSLPLRLFQHYFQTKKLPHFPSLSFHYSLCDSLSHKP